MPTFPNPSPRRAQVAPLAAFRMQAEHRLAFMFRRAAAVGPQHLTGVCRLRSPQAASMSRVRAKRSPIAAIQAGMRTRRVRALEDTRDQLGRGDNSRHRRHRFRNRGSRHACEVCLRPVAGDGPSDLPQDLRRDSWRALQKSERLVGGLRKQDLVWKVRLVSKQRHDQRATYCNAAVEQPRMKVPTRCGPERNSARRPFEVMSWPRVW
jgi:hypothetical protein